MASSSSPERALQEELKDAGNRLLTTPSSTHELLSILDKLEHLLYRVDQAPSKSMRDALRPLIKMLTDQDLLRHSEIDVKVSVISCINEIMRVTAPDAPYDDEPMKEIFELTVMALEKLSLASGRCYTKAVSILGTFATVRSCLVMLDLECDELIVAMFQLFLNTIRSDHPPSVFSDMETIMTTVIEESEEIPLELLIPLLSSVKKENKNVWPLSWKLGENVIRKCATKLKPYLPPAVQFMHVNLNDFAEIVFSICLDASGREHAHKDIALDAVCSAGDGSSLDGSSRSVLNDSTDHLNSTKSENPAIKTELVSKKRGRKPNSLIKPEEGYDRSWVIGGRKAIQSPHHRKNHEKRVGSSSKDSTVKETDQSESEKETKHLIFSPKASHSENIDALPSQHHKFPDESPHKRGRPNKKVNLMLPEGDLDAMLVQRGDLSSSEEKVLQSADITSVKESEVTRNLKAKTERGSRKKAVDAKTNLHSNSTPGNAGIKKEDVVPSGSEGKQEASMQQMDGKKQSRGNSISGKHVTKESSGKKAIPFSANRSLNTDESPLEEASKEKCKRKRTPRKEEVCEMTSDTKNHGEELVGCEIKVWWPLDHRFYEGAIYSFDPIDRKHRVLYADGDEETLDLSTERWKLVGKSNFPEQGQETESTDLPSSDALPDMPLKKKVQTRSECSAKKKHAASSAESSGGASGGESKVEAQNLAATHV